MGLFSGIKKAVKKIGSGAVNVVKGTGKVLTGDVDGGFKQIGKGIVRSTEGAFKLPLETFKLPFRATAMVGNALTRRDDIDQVEENDQIVDEPDPYADIDTCKEQHNPMNDMNPMLAMMAMFKQLMQQMQNPFGAQPYPPQQMPYGPQQMAYPPQQMAYPPQQMAYPPQQMAYQPQQMAYGPQISQIMINNTTNNYYNSSPMSSPFAALQQPAYQQPAFAPVQPGMYNQRPMVNIGNVGNLVFA